MTLSALRELEALTTARQAVLLALLHARVAREEPAGLEHRVEPIVDLHQGAGDAEAQRAGLAVDAAATARHRRRTCRSIRWLRAARGPGTPASRGRDSPATSLTVDRNLAAARAHEHATTASLRRPTARCARPWHVLLLSLPLYVSFVCRSVAGRRHGPWGFCAECGCSAPV